jgi:hypothetical protein
MSTSPSPWAARHANAWLTLVVILALHVTDEALTDFLSVYNPIVLQLRAAWSWFPMPTFTFGSWLGGLIVLVIVLALLTPAIRTGGWLVAGGSVVFGVLMFMNGVGHLAGSAYFRRWLPGATTAPLLLAGGTWLLHATWRRVRRREG